jgi:hypothetical protein
MRGVQLMAARDYESAASYFGLAEAPRSANAAAAPDDRPRALPRQ